MQEKFLKLFFLIICLSASILSFSQEKTLIDRSDSTILDSLAKSRIILNYYQTRPEIKLSTDQALKFLQERFKAQYWNNPDDSLRFALGQLIFEASHLPLDSSAYFLKNYPYDSLNVPWDKFYIWKPFILKIPDGVDTLSPVDKSTGADPNLITGITDSLKQPQVLIPLPLDTIKPTTGLKDTIIMVAVDTLSRVTPLETGFPFRYVQFPYEGDSIKIAVQSLLKFLEDRDSIRINFTGVDDSVIHFWLNSRSGNMQRFWLKNEFSDSVTVWIGNRSRDTIGLYLERGISFRRPLIQENYSDAKIDVQSLDNSKLLDMQKIVVKHQYWKYRTESSFALNQASLSNWVKGGENSISTALDITSYADYTNKLLKLSSNNFARLKIGFLASGSDGIRKNLDLLETNSKLNHKAFGKFDFSGILLFKTQVAKGFSYTKVNDKDTSILVSRFMNPAILTIGLGLDYKPNKTTSLNFSPLSYKGTFVTDPAYYNQTYDSTRIDQTKYGIPKDKKSMNEPGASFMISNVFKPVKNVTITNRLQLFTNYIHNPQNIDIDWEMILVAHLNWFTDVRFNTHFIFDDDTKTVVLDKKDGKQKKTARPQFKEMLGFSFAFRF